MLAAVSAADVAEVCPCDPHRILLDAGDCGFVLRDARTDGIWLRQSETVTLWPLTVRTRPACRCIFRHWVVWPGCNASTFLRLPSQHHEKRIGYRKTRNGAQPHVVVQHVSTT